MSTNRLGKGLEALIRSKEEQFNGNSNDGKHSSSNISEINLKNIFTNPNQPRKTFKETSIAKAFCNKAGFDICNEAMQVMGGTGYSQETLVEYCFRKSRGWQIAGGSTEMMKNRIAEDIFERRFSQRPNK